MAKPFNPYQGPAPAAMAQMGQGILEAGARIGQTLQRGYESMGQGIAGGITAAADAYSDYKKTQSNVKASEKAYDTFRSFLDPEVQKSIDTRIEEMNKDTSMSLRDKAAFWDQAKTVMGGAINQKFGIDKQQQELNARKAIMEYEQTQANLRQAATLQNQLDLEQQRARYKALEGGGGGAFGGGDFGLMPGQESTGAKSSLFNKKFGF
jgi:cell fate (sporulation/competence/biofilm development) regulator YlbF (YheA/YmcA/DUF963 family)